EGGSTPMQRSLAVVPAIIASACVLSACGSTTTPTTTTTTTPVTTSTSAVTRNLVVTPSIRQSLLNAGAKYHSLPSTDYVGLDAGKTYYAVDPSNYTYYAAA